MDGGGVSRRVGVSATEAAGEGDAAASAASASAALRSGRRSSSSGVAPAVVRYERPQVVTGKATVEGDGTLWRVTAGAGTELELGLPLRSAALAGAAPVAPSVAPAAPVAEAATRRDTPPPSIRATP